MQPAFGFDLSEEAAQIQYDFELSESLDESAQNALYQENGFSYVLAHPGEGAYTPDPVLNDEQVKSLRLTKIDTAGAGALMSRLPVLRLNSSPGAERKANGMRTRLTNRNGGCLT